MENKDSLITENEITSQEKKSKTPVFLISLVVIVLLAGAAFVGAKMLSNQAAVSNENVDFTAAEGVPQEEPELIGIVVKTDGDSLIVQEFNINDTLGSGGNGGVVVSEPIFVGGDPENSEGADAVVPEFLGGSEAPQIEVIINQDTVIYKDVTEFPEITSEDLANGGMPNMPDKIEQKVELGSIEDLGTTSYVTVWGEKKGDRVYATVIVYQPPITFSMPAN